jgi:hypothetical protein
MGTRRADDGSPLPRRTLCSFLATAGDPSPNFGGGVVRMGRIQHIATNARREDLPLSRTGQVPEGADRSCTGEGAGG